MKLSEKAVFFMSKSTLNDEKTKIYTVNFLKTSSSSDDKILSSEKNFFLKQYHPK
jgi:hypothetical protein